MTYLHYSIVLEQIVVLLVDPSLDPTCVPLLTIGLDILAPAWAFWCSHPFEICSYLKEICGIELDLRDINFSFCL
jgi:hypothetical protein